MATAVDSKSFSGVSGANSAQFQLKGGYYQLATVASAYGTNGIELQILGPDASTWLSAPTALKRTTNGTIAGYLPPGQYRLTVDASVTAGSAAVAGVPVS
jgi:hypothetical protein